MLKNENNKEYMSDRSDSIARKHDNNEEQAFKVYMRIRPLNERETNMNKANLKTSNNNSKIIPNSKYVHDNYNEKSILVTDDKLVFVLDPDSKDISRRKEKSFVFDEVFNENHSNFHIFNSGFKTMIDNLMEGFNSTVMAYGVTGTGKTHTIFGNSGREYNENHDCLEKKSENIEKGISIWALDYLLELISINQNKKPCTLKLSYLEIYNEHVRDLLAEKSKSLMIVEDSWRGVVVPDLSEFIVRDSREIMKLIIEGNSRRTMAPTNLNQFSSRSHAILQVAVEQRNKIRDIKEEILISKFLIVDLAGSERGGLEKGIRTQEGSNINKSLLSLGNCINLLSDKTRKGAFVPYRDSKLTRILKDSLGGNIQTAMIACVSPSPLTYDDTVNTLKYATRARTIQKKISKNVREVDVHVSQYKEIIDSLKNEIDQLKKIIQNQENIINSKSYFSNDDKIKKDYSSQISNNDEKVEELINNHHNVKISMSSKKNLHELQIIDGSNIWNNPPATKSTFVPKRDSYLEKYSKANILKSQISNLNTLTNCEKLSELVKTTETPEEFDNLEKLFDNLQSERVKIEEDLKNSGTHDRSCLNEKYKQIKNCLSKYLEFINDKLIENIEQNMILKFNLNEILELNKENSKHFSDMYTHLINLEKEELNLGESEDRPNEEISKLKEDMKNIEITMKENEAVKEKISQSLQQNFNQKKLLKNNLIKLISYNSNFSKEIDSTPDKTNELQNLFENLNKEKKELETKNKTYQEILTTVLEEKKQKDLKLKQIQKELNNLKNQLAEKDNKFKSIDINGSKNVSNMTNIKDDKNFETYNLKEKDEDVENETPQINTEVENLEINLQDDYFDTIQKKSLLDVDSEIISLNQRDPKEKSSTEKIHNIRNIINHTNNIVNNNINKIKKLEDEKKQNIPKKKLEESISTKKVINRKTSCNVTPTNTNKKRLTAIQMHTNYRIINLNVNSNNRIVSSKSPKFSRKKEFDKIIETQLNEVYNRRAKELGDKIKKKITKNTPRLSSKKFPSVLGNKNIENFNSILDKFQKKSDNTTNTPINNQAEIKNSNNEKIKNDYSFDRSFSLSCVSVKNEIDNNSAIEMVDNIKEKQQLVNKNSPKFKSTKSPQEILIFEEKEDYFLNTSAREKKNSLTNRNSIKFNNNSKILLHSSSVIPISRNTLQRNSLKNKKVPNVLKFLSNDNQITLGDNYKTSEFERERGKSLKRLSCSPSPINQLKMARLEKQLKNNNYVESFLNKNEENCLKLSNNYTNNLKNLNLNKFVKRNTINFLNEYALNLNKASINLENENVEVMPSHSEKIEDGKCKSILNEQKEEEILS